jgi:hypothetical protein
MSQGTAARVQVQSVSELAPNLGPPRLVNSGFIRRLAGSVGQVADAPSALLQARYVAAARYSLYAKPRIFAALRRGSLTSLQASIQPGTSRSETRYRALSVGFARPAKVERDPVQEGPQVELLADEGGWSLGHPAS